jgi:hypothetical protein
MFAKSPRSKARWSYQQLQGNTTIITAFISWLMPNPTLVATSIPFSRMFSARDPLLQDTAATGTPRMSKAEEGTKERKAKERPAPCLERRTRANTSQGVACPPPPLHPHPPRSKAKEPRECSCGCCGSG